MEPIPFRAPNELSTAVFILIVAFVVASILGGTFLSCRDNHARAQKRSTQVGIGLAVWMLASAVLAESGVFESHPLPSIPMFVTLMIFGAFAFGLTPVGTEIARRIRLSTLVAFQAFRLPLELVLHSWVEQGTIPATMTWTGQNLDIVSGLVALVAAPLAARWKWAAWVANVVGIVLLINVGRVVVMSSPLPIGWGVEPPLMLIAHFPYVWIGSVCVAGAVFGHVVLTRALLLRK